MLNVLVVDDEPPIREFVQLALSERGHTVTSASDGAQAMTWIDRKAFDVVICDVRLPKVDGLTIFRRLRKEKPATQVILMTAYGTVGDAVRAMRERALDYMTKPFELDDLMQRVAEIEDRKRMELELVRARQELERLRPAALVVGQAPSMVALYQRIEMVAKSDCPVMLTGESGTGKDLFAKTIHELSDRNQQPFVAINCSAFPEALLEAELFGHERGAFTGAHKRRDGRFKAADGGTLLLDEIGEMPLAAQAKLLRVLQDGAFQPIGTNTDVRVDVRVVSATNRDIKQAVTEGRFREDLYYRLNVVHLHIPPLRARRGDLPLLIEHFLRALVRAGKTPPRLSPRAWAAISGHAFPGNVRELEHALRHALVMTPGEEIDIDHLPDELRGTAGASAARTGEVRPLGDAMRQFEREYVLQAVAHVAGSKTRAAELLGISRKTLWEKLRLYGEVMDDSEVITLPPGTRKKD